MNNDRNTVLVVEDDPPNRELMRDALEDDGYRVVVARCGSEAFELMDAGVIDVVLLDLSLPDVDGLEVCRQFNGAVSTAHIPVIMVTGKRRRGHRLEGIDAGATDYLTKPVDLGELLLRVRNAIETKRRYDLVKSEYQRMAELEKHRDDLVHMIVHDLRSPLLGVVGNLDVLTRESKPLPESAAAAITAARSCAHHVEDMIQQILDVSRLESNRLPLKCEQADMSEVVADAVKMMGARSDRIKHTRRRSAVASFDRSIMARVICNLIGNAIDFSPRDEPVTVGAALMNDKIFITVSDHGPGVTEEDGDKIFGKFRQSHQGPRRVDGTAGLGLAFCRLAVEAHGGSIGVDGAVGGGARFWIQLPVVSPHRVPSPEEHPQADRRAS